MQPISLKSKYCTDSADITYAASDEPKFSEKTQLYWNGTLRNTRIKKDTGFPSTSGKNIKYEEADNGVNIITDGKTINMPFTSVLKDYYKIQNKASGKQIAHCVWNERVFTLYKDSQQTYTVVETDKNDKEINHKQLPKDTSAMFTSVYNIDEEPLIFINTKTKYSITNFINNVSVYKVTDWFDFVENQPEYEYKLDAEKAVNVQILKAKWEEATEATATALHTYQLAIETYYYTQKQTDKEKAAEAYAQYITQYNQLQEAEKAYLTALWNYNPQEEIDYCNEQIEKESNEKSVATKALKDIEETNATQLEKKEQLEKNIANLDAKISSLREEIYSAKAPELSDEAKAIKKEADEKLKVTEEEYNAAHLEWLGSVKVYLNNLDKFSSSFSWSWSISSTQSRSGSYTFSGKKLREALPSYLPTVGRYIATGATVEVNSNSVGTLSGSGSIDGSKVRLSTNSGNGFTYRTLGSVAYLSSYNGVFYGFNYNAIGGYTNVVKKYQVEQEALGRVAASKVEWAQTMNSNVELSNYLAFINSYESMKEELEQYVINVSLLRGTYGALLNEIDEVLRQIHNKEVEIEHITATLEDLRKQLARATLDLEALPKSEKIDDQGNVVYKTLSSIFSWESSDGVPLGDANSGTTFRDNNSNKWIVVGFDDDDKNRAIILYWNENDKKVVSIKWYGVVAPTGTITGEPIPDPDTFTERTRQSNGTYRWDMQNGGNSRVAGSLIGGYYFNHTTSSYNKIVIDEWKAGESVRVNISANDTLTAEEVKEGKPDPIRFFVSNFADSRGIYYDYGQGWLKTYVRKINSSSRQIFDCYIYTYGMVSENNLPYQKESLMAKGKTAVWTYDADKLNKRIYTVGGTNKADDSILTLLPFSVNILPEETNATTGQALPTLRAQIYGLLPLSFSYNKSLVSNGEEHGDWVVQTSADGNTIILSVSSMIYIIKKTSSYEDFKVWKVADYYYQTNILSDDNTIIEDRDGNINVERGNIPYAEECKLDIEQLNLTIPPSNQLVTNDTWYWAAAYNPFFLKGVNASYLLPAIALPLYIDSSQLEAFQTEALEQRGSILKPMLKGLFDEYEEVDIFYTVATVTSTLYYKTSNIVKVSDIDEDKYDIFGKETFDVDLNGTTYAVSTSTQFFPLGIGSVLSGVNYITPTIGLEDEYAVRLYTNNNRVYGGYQFAARIYNGTNVFTIYGRNYYYDRQGIYFIGTSSTYTANQFVCYALGMKYLANSGSEAYFYSYFDKSIYIFTGSNTLQKMLSLSNQGEIADSLFSSQEQILYLLTDENKLLMFKEDDLAALDLDIEGKLYGTELGCAIIADNKYEIISPYREWDRLPFALSTVFMGSDAGLTKLSHFDFLAYKMTDDPVTFKVTVETLNGIERATEVKNITITKDMWKGRSYRLRYSPRNCIGNSFRVGLYSNDDVAVSFHGWEAAPYGNTAAPNR